MDEKILIYTNKNASKAKLFYDLNECELKGKYINESILNDENLTTLKKNNLHIISENNLNTVSLSKQTTSIYSDNNFIFEEQKENISSNHLFNQDKPNSINTFRTKMNSTSNVFGLAENSSQRFSFNKFENKNYTNIIMNDVVKPNLNCLSRSRLNYEIEINHPFLEKCVIRGSNILEAFDLHKRMQQIVAEFD